MHTNGRIKVLVAHELPLVAAGLDSFLSKHIDLAVIADAGCRDRPEAWRGRSFDVIVADYTFALRLANGTGKAYGPTNIIAVTEFDGEAECAARSKPVLPVMCYSSATVKKSSIAYTTSASAHVTCVPLPLAASRTV